MRLASLTQFITFKILLSWVKHQFISFCGWVVFHCVNVCIVDCFCEIQYVNLFFSCTVFVWFLMLDLWNELGSRLCCFFISIVELTSEIGWAWRFLFLKTFSYKFSFFKYYQVYSALFFKISLLRGFNFIDHLKEWAFGFIENFFFLVLCFQFHWFHICSLRVILELEDSRFLKFFSILN